MNHYYLFPRLFEITEDRIPSVPDLLRIGNYAWHNRSISANHFPIRTAGPANWQLKLLEFEGFIRTEKAIETIASLELEQPWSAAHVEQTLMFGARFPLVQCIRPIVGLNAMIGEGGNQQAVCLKKERDGRAADLCWSHFGWPNDHVFLLFRSFAS